MPKVNLLILRQEWLPSVASLWHDDMVYLPSLQFTRQRGSDTYISLRNSAALGTIICTGGYHACTILRYAHARAHHEAGHGVHGGVVDERSGIHRSWRRDLHKLANRQGLRLLVPSNEGNQRNRSSVKNMTIFSEVRCSSQDLQVRGSE